MVKKTKGQEHLTQATRQVIIDSRYDFTAVSQCMSDIRKCFWNIQATNEIYKKKKANLGIHFYQQVVPGKGSEQEQRIKSLKRGGFM